MKKGLSTVLALILLVCCVSGTLLQGSAANACTWNGTTVTLEEAKVTTGTEFELNAVLTIDASAYDRFDACNLKLSYDNSVIDLAGQATTSIYAKEDAYSVMPQKMDHGYNVIIINLSQVEPTSSGYSCTLAVKMQVVDAAKFIADGGATVTLGLHNDDFNIVKDAVLYSYQHNVAGQGKIDMSVTFAPMAVKVEGAAPKETYTVSFNSNGGSSVADVSVEKGAAVTMIAPTKSGSTFEGWYTESSLTNKVSSGTYRPTADITLYAKWTEDKPAESGEWKVEFETNGGSKIDPVNVKKGESVTLLTPTKTGNTFEGWYVDKALTNKVGGSTYKPEANITLYAKWTENKVVAEEWTLSFESNGGNKINPIKVKKGESASLPTPTRSGFTFDGWYTEVALTNKVSGNTYKPEADTTLYAKWTENKAVVEEWTVSFESNGGSKINPIKVKKGDSATLPTSVKSGYTFAGWYTDSALTNKVSGTTFKPEADTTLYAKWTAAGGGNTVPKTGLQSPITALIIAMGALLAVAGVVVFDRYRKMS